MHVLLSQSSNRIQALANSKQLLSSQQDVFTFVLDSPVLLEELDEREHSVLDFFGHLEHFTESQVQVKYSASLIA